MRSGPIKDDPLRCPSCKSRRIRSVPALPAKFKPEWSEPEKDDFKAMHGAYINAPSTIARLESGEISLCDSKDIDPAGTSVEDRVTASTARKFQQFENQGL